MKRTHDGSRATRTGDIRKDLTAEQLYSIGSVAIAYNEAELFIDLIMAMLLRLGDNRENVSSRINGIDGKIEIVKAAAAPFLDDSQRLFLAETLGDSGFSELKKYRDGIIHCRVHDAVAAIGVTPPKRGKSGEILLSLAALEGVYTRLCTIRQELVALMQLTAHALNRSIYGFPKDSVGGLLKQSTEQDIQICWSQAQEYRKNRLSLPPLPKFPEENAERPK